MLSVLDCRVAGVGVGLGGTRIGENPLGSAGVPRRPTQFRRRSQSSRVEPSAAAAAGSRRFRKKENKMYFSALAPLSCRLRACFFRPDETQKGAESHVRRKSGQPGTSGSLSALEAGDGKTETSHAFPLRVPAGNGWRYFHHLLLSCRAARRLR